MPGPVLARVRRPHRSTVDVDGHLWHMRVDDGRVTVAPGPAADAVAHVRLGAQQLDDLASDQQTFMSMWAANCLDQPKGNIGHLLDWWLVWRAALDGTPIHTPGAIAFTDRDGAPLDLTRTFGPGDRPEEMRHFLEEAGFMHLSGVFDEDEMAAASADMDDAAPRYAPDDGRSWWAPPTAMRDSCACKASIASRQPCTTCSTMIASYGLPRSRAPGTSSVCAGRRTASRRCSSRSASPKESPTSRGTRTAASDGTPTNVAASRSASPSPGADDVSGQLRVIAGSHRALVWSGIRQPDLDLPEVPLPTRTGDVTLHLSCTMHMAQPPVERERRVMYSGFSLPPLGGADPDALAAARARRGDVRESAPLTVLDRHFKS